MEDPGLPSLRREYLCSLDVVTAATARAVAALEEGTSAREVVRAHVVAGGAVSGIADLIDAAPVRSSLSGSLEELERARHRAQCLLFRLAHAEGQSMSAIGRTYGISRQLVSRLINESLSDPA